MKFSAFLLRLFLIAVLIVILAGNPGIAHITWHETEIETSAAFLLFVLFLFSFVLFFFYKVFLFIKQGPRFWRLKRRVKGLEEGTLSFSQALNALAAGDFRAADKLSRKLSKVMGKNSPAKLLLAQSASLSGDKIKAHALFKDLSEQSDTMVYGYRGLIVGALQEGRMDEVERLVDLLAEKQPGTPWIDRVRFDLAIGQGAFDKAQQLVRSLSSRGDEGMGVSKEEQASLFLARALLKSKAGQTREALLEAEKAKKIAPHWIPALLAFAKHQADVGDDKAALKSIAKAWKGSPHLDFVTLYQEIDSENNPLDTYKAIEKIIKKTDDRVLFLSAMGQVALAASLWGEARRFLTELDVMGAATQKTYRLLAYLEEKETGGKASSVIWLEKAFDAPRDPCWICSSCGMEESLWTPHCSHCSSFYSLFWHVPGERHRAPSSVRKSLAFLSAAVV